MKIEQYFYAVEIADTGSFSQAARNLYVSQPNLSYAIKQLEQMVGFPLFIRTPSGVSPTPEGAELIAHFRAMKQEYTRIQEFFERTDRTTRLTLRIATMNASRTTAAFSNIIKRYIGSPIQFSFLNYSSLDELLPSVQTCQVDFAIIGSLAPFQSAIINKLQNHAIEYHSFGVFPIQVIVGPKSPLYHNSGPLTLSELYPHTVVQYSSVSADLENQITSVIELNRHVYGEINVNTSQLYYHVLQNTPAFGLVSTTPQLFDRYNAYPELRIRPLQDCPVTAQFGWIKQRRFPLSDIAAELLQYINPLFQ